MCSVKNLGIRKYPCDFVPCPSKKAARLKLRRTNQATGVDEFLLLSWQMCCRPSTAKKGKVAAPAFVSHIGFDFRQLCPRAKDEKRQTAARIRYPYRCFLLVSLCQNGTARMPSPTKENAILHTFILAWFSRFYRQSENRHPNACSLFVSAHILFHSKTPLALLPIFENYLSICRHMNKTSIHNLSGT